MIERTSSSAWVRGVVRMFEAEGVDSGALLRECGVAAERLDDPAARFTIDEVSLLWERAVQRSGKATLGLTRELAGAHGKLGLVGYAMMASATLLDALQWLHGAIDVLSNAATFELVPDARGCWIVFGHQGGSRPVPRQRSEFGLLTMLAFGNWVTGRHFSPLQVEFVHPAPADVSAHQAAFECPLRFAASANRALLRHEDLALPLTTHDPQVATLQRQLVADELHRLGSGATRQRVSLWLATRLGEVHRLSRSEPRRDEAAQALGLSDRTLQRRLQAEGTSFQQLLDDTRRELAQHWLLKPDASIKQVAAHLGFEDPSTFFRACRRWFGESPGAWRARHVAAQALVLRRA